MWKTIIGHCYQNKTTRFKTETKKVAHKAVESTSGFIGNTITNKIVKQKSVPEVLCIFTLNKSYAYL